MSPREDGGDLDDPVQGPSPADHLWLGGTKCAMDHVGDLKPHLSPSVSVPEGPSGQKSYPGRGSHDPGGMRDVGTAPQWPTHKRRGTRQDQTRSRRGRGRETSLMVLSTGPDQRRGTQVGGEGGDVKDDGLGDGWSRK